MITRRGRDLGRETTALEAREPEPDAANDVDGRNCDEEPRRLLCRWYGGRGDRVYWRWGPELLGSCERLRLDEGIWELEPEGRKREELEVEGRLWDGRDAVWRG